MGDLELVNLIKEKEQGGKEQERFTTMVRGFLLGLRIKKERLGLAGEQWREKHER